MKSSSKQERVRQGRAGTLVWVGTQPAPAVRGIQVRAVEEAAGATTA